jgi:hypothetical protein
MAGLKQYVETVSAFFQNLRRAALSSGAKCNPRRH